MRHLCKTSMFYSRLNLIATCQTNIKCLGVISETLDSGENLANVTQDDLEQVHGKLNVTKEVTKYHIGSNSNYSQTNFWGKKNLS